LDLRYEDKDLVGILNHKNITSPRKAGEYVGYSGVLVICGFDNNYYAYDLCCPNESSKSIKVVANDIGQAVCPKCGTVYDIGYGSGAPVQGVSKYAMRRYNITASGQQLLIQY
jgi:nitrite reductase/ring-hydroxylating ferredoxin subunit